MQLLKHSVVLYISAIYGVSTIKTLLETGGGIQPRIYKNIKYDRTSIARGMSAWNNVMEF